MIIEPGLRILEGCLGGGGLECHKLCIEMAKASDSEPKHRVSL